MNFQDVLVKNFPNAMLENRFVRHTYQSLLPYGFDHLNTTACVGLCHHQDTQSLRIEIQQVWDNVHNLSSAAGLLFLARPDSNEYGDLILDHMPDNKYVIYSFSHLTLGPNGEVSLCQQPSQGGASSACGALAAFKQELTLSYLEVELDPYDRHNNRRKQNLYNQVQTGKLPNLIKLAKLTSQIILDDLKQILSMPEQSSELGHPAHINDYAIFSGVLIHGPKGLNYTWLDETYIVSTKQSMQSELTLA